MADILCFNKSFIDILEDIDTITSNGQIIELSDFDIFRGTVTNSKNKYATVEYNKWRLDGTYSLINPEEQVIGYWSDTVSGATYESDYAGYQLGSGNTGWRYLDITFQNYHTKQDIDGITLIFRDSEDFASRFQIQLYYDTTVKKSWNILNYTSIISQSFSEFESATTDDADDTEHDYSIGRFNKIRLYFLAANKPNRFIGLANIRFGYATWLNEDSFYDLSLLEESSLVSDTIPINTLTFSVNANKAFIKTLSNCDYVELYRNNTQFGSFYLRNIEKNTTDNYTINCQDVISILDDTDYPDNLFITTESNPISVTDVINDIMSGIDVLYEIDELLNNSTVSIKFSSLTKREALSQILLASNAVCKKLRNGSLWFGRLDTTNIAADISDDLFDNYTITDNSPVSTISMSTVIYEKGNEINTSNLTWNITEQTKDYITVTISNFPALITSEDLEVNFYFTLVFYQNIPTSAVTTEHPYSVTTAVRNYMGELQNNKPIEEGKYLPEKFNISSSSISIKIDRDAINRRTHIGAYHYGTRPKMAMGTSLIGQDQNIYDCDIYITPYLDFTKSIIKDTLSGYVVTAYELTIGTDSRTVAVSNSNISLGKQNAQDLSIQTIEMTELTIDGETDNVIDLLMDRYYQYNKEFDGTILTGDLVCGDTIQLTLPDIGLVTGTIRQLEYNLTNKLIAKAKIWLYYIED